MALTLHGTRTSNTDILTPDFHGAIIQCISTTKTTNFSTTATSYTDITGLSVAITPTSTSNKILVTGSLFASHSNDKLSFFNLVRDSTNICQSTDSTSSDSTVFQDTEAYEDHDRAINNIPINFLDSPSTTSSTTYKIQVRTTENTVYINRRGLNNGACATSTITVMEVVA